MACPGGIWLEDLSAHGGQLAAVCPDGTPISYRDLDARVVELCERLGTQRRLVLLATSNHVEALVAYLACLRGEHPVLLAAPDRMVALAERYDPDVVISSAAGSWRIDERRAGSAHTLHPELALLLATSGSTGSPKLVRLSAANLVANAAAIAEYLDIRPTDRATVSLPMHYCYGLSVINSNLARGAALLFTDKSATDPRFWAGIREHGGTSLHCVPYTFELLDRVGFRSMRLPQLRYVTQAGGRLDPNTVSRYAKLGARRGWQLFVMYGQTEATARMAYLPPELTVSCPSAIGRPIPGGSFHLEPSGELVYRGPNVMLGYARYPADLALGRTVRQLHTGDLARRRPDGLYEIVGRQSRFIKQFGLRIDLDEVERLLGERGYVAAATGNDEELVIALTGRADEPTRALVTSHTGLPPHRVRIVRLDRLPRLPNGKLDHPAITRLTAPTRPLPGRGLPRPPSSRGGPAWWPALDRYRRRAPRRSVRDAFRSVFGERHLPDEATFVSLGGDSLSYIRMGIELQQVLGHLPKGWEHTAIEQLAQLPRQRARPTLETAVALRAAAIMLVVGSHVGVFYLPGGAHLLLAMSGWAFARFTLPEGRSGTASRPILRAAVQIALPSMLWIAARSVTQDDVHLRNALLLNYLIDPSTWGYWYVETLVQSLLLVALILALPAVNRWERAQPFRFAAIALLITILGPLFPDSGNEFSDRLMSPHLVLWLFMLGWLVQRAASIDQQLLAGGAILWLVPPFFHEPSRAAIVTGGLLLLVLLPRLPVPRSAIRPVGMLATSSLAIYLTHYAIFPPLLPYLPPAAVVAVCLGSGILVGQVYATAVRHIHTTWWRASTRRQAR